MRANRLTYGDRPISVALRPHLLERSQFEAHNVVAELIARVLEKIAAAAVRFPALMTKLGLTDAEQKVALIDPGFTRAAVTTRLDGFVHGQEIKFVEYNAENPSSLSDQEGLNRVLVELPAMSVLAQRYCLQQFSPVERLLATLLAVYREWNGNGVPNIAIVDWKNLRTANEFILLRDHFAARGVRTIICSPNELEYNRGRLRCGDFEIDLVYKRMIIHEFLAEYDETHTLVRAYVNHHVCLVNPFRCKIMHKKASFELLTDGAYASWFTSKERAAIARSIPWTRRMVDRRTTCRGRSVELVEFARKNRAHLVLKPNDDYGGHGVYLGPRLDQSGWEKAIATALRPITSFRKLSICPQSTFESLTRPIGTFRRCLSIQIHFSFAATSVARWFVYPVRQSSMSPLVAARQDSLLYSNTSMQRKKRPTNPNRRQARCESGEDSRSNEKWF